MTALTHLPRLLSIAGSDSSGGAGIQADLKTFAAHGGYGMTAITAITAQNTLGVTAVQSQPPALVAAQIDAVFADPGVDAVKIGMLADGVIIAAVAGCLAAALGSAARLPIVLDPVMIAKSGDPLLDADAVDHLQRLFPLATLITPNLPEAERLDGRAAATPEARERLVRRLGERCGAVLLKGGHAEGGEIVDLLWDGSGMHRFVHSRILSRSTHGTGCTLSSAIAARLGRGESLVAAVSGAIDWLHQAIARAIPIGAGVGPVDHFWRQRRADAADAGGRCFA
ncbi:MAG: bifunctional hydroxymethylpyrimidine kinase/phosphomethylpyrimidine kinase [Thermoanaerobaculia bacterium]